MTQTQTQTHTRSGTERRERVVRTMLTAFSPDPLMRWFYPDASDYLDYYPGFVEHLGGRAFEHGTADSLDEERGAALWLPPGVTYDDEAVTAYMVGSLDEERGEAAAEFAEAVARFEPEEPHWYLAVLGVDPPFQSGGLGSELLAPRLKQFDAAGEIAHLVSSNPRNLPFYQRHGFEIMGEVRVADGPPTWPMLRTPR